MTSEAFGEARAVISVRSETHDFRSSLILFVSELGDVKSMAYRRRSSQLASQKDSRFVMEVPGDGDISEEETETRAEGDAIADVAVTDSDKCLTPPLTGWVVTFFSRKKYKGVGERG